jgi:acyl-coenzyme A thioesterase PaaI-like protein
MFAKQIGALLYGESIVSVYENLSRKPLGKWLFSKAIGRLAPYTGSIKPYILELTTGHVVVQFTDRRFVRNHLSSVHAMALANLGEVATGLAVVSKLPRGTRAILTDFKIKYVKKARGPLLARCDFADTVVANKQPYIALAVIQNTKGECVAEVEATWLVDTTR